MQLCVHDSGLLNQLLCLQNTLWPLGAGPAKQLYQNEEWSPLLPALVKALLGMLLPAYLWKLEALVGGPPCSCGSLGTGILLGERLCLHNCLLCLGTPLRGLGVEPLSGMPSSEAASWLTPPGGMGEPCSGWHPYDLLGLPQLGSLPAGGLRGTGFIGQSVGHLMLDLSPCCTDAPLLVFNKSCGQFSFHESLFGLPVTCWLH